MFALWGEEAVFDDGSGSYTAGIAQQSGGITAGYEQRDQPFQGYNEVDLTFPQDLSNCVALVGSAAPNDGFDGIDDLQPAVASILGSKVRVYSHRPQSGIMGGFAISVVC